jgi:hypothetical protein
MSNSSQSKMRTVVAVLVAAVVIAGVVFVLAQQGLLTDTKTVPAPQAVVTSTVAPAASASGASLSCETTGGAPATSTTGEAEPPRAQFPT